MLVPHCYYGTIIIRVHTFRKAKVVGQHRHLIEDILNILRGVNRKGMVVGTCGHWVYMHKTSEKKCERGFLEVKKIIVRNSWWGAAHLASRIQWCTVQ